MRLYKSRNGIIGHVSTEEALYLIQTLAERLKLGFRSGPVAELRAEKDDLKFLTLEVLDATKGLDKNQTDKAIIPPGGHKA